MLILVDKDAASQAQRRDQNADNGDVRTYYHLPGCVIVCRNGTELERMIGAVVDAAIGWDRSGGNSITPRPPRAKVTIFRVMDNAQSDRSLTDVLDAQEQVKHVIGYA